MTQTEIEFWSEARLEEALKSKGVRLLVVEDIGGGIPAEKGTG